MYILILDETCRTDLTGNKYKDDGSDEYCELIDPGEEKKERACDSLIMCILTTLNQGLRNGGGIGDILRAPSTEVPFDKVIHCYFTTIHFSLLQEALFVPRVIYDLLFFFVVIIIVLNLIFGVIIDTFADLRTEKQQKEVILKDTCFICGKVVKLFFNKFYVYFLPIS